MRIAVIGCGAMGGLYSAYLSKGNEVTVIDVVPDTINNINERGLVVEEPDGSVGTYRPKAALSADEVGPVDLAIVFVKATVTEAALKGDLPLFGPDTYLLTLQNGGGHEEVLGKFVPADHVVIGTTQHNASRTEEGAIRHGGSGLTVIGSAAGNLAPLGAIAESFNSCGIACEVSDNVQQLIWNKIFTNVSASALTGLFQMPLGFIVQNEHAWELCTRLIREAVEIATANGFDFDFDTKLAEVRHVCEASPAGLTSIYSDIKFGRRTEVDTISGYVVRAARTVGVPAPNHEFVVEAIHALEGKSAFPAKER